MSKYPKRNKYKNKEVVNPEDRSKKGKFAQDEAEHKYNDVSWYTKNEQMLRDAASLSFNNPVGVKLPRLMSEVDASGYYWAAGHVVPGLCSLRILPGVGMTTNASSPLNLAANNIYAFVRYQNSGAKNYDQADLMLYLLAMNNLYAYWNWMKRIYGYVNSYSQYNRYMPEVFARADRVDFKDVLDHLAEFRLYLNNAAAKLTSFCVPAVMSIFIRQSWMFSNIYKDSENMKAQLYMFNPVGFYKLSETGSKFGGSLILQQFVPQGSDPKLLKLDEIQNYFDLAINAMSYSEDIGVMSGDVLKAYGQEKLFKLSSVDPDYMVVPVYNEEVLNQIHNSTILPLDCSDAGINITQNPDTGFLVWNPTKCSFPEKVHRDRVLLNMPWDDVTPANVMVGTRLTCAYMMNPSGTIAVHAIGTECVVERSYYTLDYASSGGTYTWGRHNMLTDNMLIAQNAQFNSFMPKMRLLALISQFDWHPIIPLCATNDSGEMLQFGGLYGDMSNYTVISSNDLQRIHETAVMSEFNIPQLGSF